MGTPSVTTRGFTEEDCRRVAKLIVRVIREKEACFGAVRAEVKALTDAHPLYPDLTAASV